MLIFHNIYALPVGIAEGNETEFSRRIDNQVLCHSADMSHRQTGPLQKLDDEVTVPDAPKTVFCDVLEPELFSKELAIDPEGVAGESTTTERKD